MNIESLDTKQLRVKGEKGDYILLLPIGSQLEETLEVCSHFTGVISKALSEFKKTQEEKESTAEPELDKKE